MSPRAVCLAGPTASGKTALALALGQEVPLEIISVDSALVYRGLDLGTAKPTAAERAQVPHHLIDILEPNQTYSAARFVADAQQLIDEIRGRGRLPLLVGGSLLYFKALREGLDPMPAADAGVRAEIDRRAAELGWPALHAELAQVDAVSAARLAPGDSQRIQRALEVWQVSGKALSAWQQRAAAPAKHPASGATSMALPLVSLEPRDRAWLHQRIALRFESMLAAGLADEVRGLRDRGDLHLGLPAMRCVGYRQTWEALDRGTLVGLREAGVAATRQLAKRQLTWLRAMADRRIVACDAEDAALHGLAALRDATRG